MAYSSYPNSVPPIHPYEYSSGDYKSSQNHHITNKQMSVNKYSLNQGIGKELSSILNFINAKNLGLPNKQIASGFIYAAGGSGTSSWWTDSLAIQHLWCRSGYINNFYPINVSYANMVISGCNMYLNNLLDANPTLELWFSGYINEDSWYMNEFTTKLNLLSGTYYYFDFVGGTGIIKQNYEKNIYPAVSFHGKMSVDNIYIYSGIVNSSGLYINVGTGISANVNSIEYNKFDGHTHTGTSKDGTKIDNFTIITATGIIQDSANFKIKDTILNIVDYINIPETTWHAHNIGGSYKNVIKFKNWLYVHDNSNQYIYRCDNDASIATITDFDTNNIKITAKPAIIENKLVFCGYDTSTSTWDPKIGYSEDGINFTILGINIDEENSWPCISGQIKPQYITKYKDKVWIFGQQWNNHPKIIYAPTGLTDGLWQSYDEENIREITTDLKHPILYNSELYFSDYTNNIYKILDYDQTLEYIVSSSPSSLIVHSMGSLANRSEVHKSAYFLNKLWHPGIMNKSPNYKIVPFNNESFDTSTDNQSVHYYYKGTIGFKDYLYAAQGTNLWRTTDGTNWVEDAGGEISKMIIFKGSLYGYKYGEDHIYKKTAYNDNWTTLSSEAGFYIYCMTVYNDRIFAGGCFTHADVWSGVMYSSIDGDTWVLRTGLLAGSATNNGPNNFIPFNNRLYCNFHNSGIYKFNDSDNSLTNIINSDDYSAAVKNFEGNMDKFNNKLYFCQDNGNIVDLYSINTSDDISIISGSFCATDSNFGVCYYNNKLIFGKANNDDLNVDNRIKYWQHYTDNKALVSGNPINYKNIFFNFNTYWNNNYTSGSYISDVNIRDAMNINGQLYYVDENHYLKKIINNEKITEKSSTSVFDTYTNKLLEVYNKRLYFLDGNGALYYKNLDPNEIYLDSYNEEL